MIMLVSLVRTGLLKLIRQLRFITCRRTRIYIGTALDHSKSVYSTFSRQSHSASLSRDVNIGSKLHLGQNKWNIWTTPPHISMMPKWRVFYSFAPSSVIALGGGGWGMIVPFYTVQDASLAQSGFFLFLHQKSREAVPDQDEEVPRKELDTTFKTDIS